MTFVPLRVTLIAQTRLEITTSELDDSGYLSLDYATEEWLPFDDDSEATPADMVAEFAGRGCYEAWARANAATRTNEAYLANIIAQGHESVFGHAAISLRVEGVSRALTLELVRHRFLVFSQRSQRFVDESSCDFVCPPLLDEHVDLRNVLLRSARRSRAEYTLIANTLVERGIPRKQARETARAALPECTETRLLVSGNVRAWRDFIKLRNADGADAEIRIFAQRVLEILRTQVAPSSVQDL